MRQIKVKPAPGRHVRIESGERLVAVEGEALPDTTYIRRRLDDGDLIQITNPARGNRKIAPAEQRKKETKNAD